MAYTASPAEMPQQGQGQGQGQRPKPEVENGNIILYRTHNFFLRTSFRPGQRQNPLRKPTGHTSVMPRLMPNQEKRIADSETRLMPNVTVNTTRQTRAIPIPILILTAKDLTAAELALLRVNVAKLIVIELVCDRVPPSRSVVMLPFNNVAPV